MKNNISTKLKIVSHDVFRNITATRARRRTIENFAKKIGLVYFGYIDKKVDDYHIVRGFTASSSHQDNHYSVGSIDDYDVSLIDRSDAIYNENNSISFCNWIIASINLKTKQDIPHVFIKTNNQNEKSYMTMHAVNPLLSKVKLGTFEYYPEDFISKFSVYSLISDSIQIEKLFPAITTRVIAAHLWPYSFEVLNGVIYIYCDTEKVTSNDLNSMLNIGLWLARHIDSKIEQI